MAKFKIFSERTGICFGEYEGETESEALDAMARDAGYADYSDACETAEVKEGSLLVIKRGLFGYELPESKF